MTTLTMSSTMPPSKPATPLREARRKNRELRAAREAKKIEEANRLMESVGLGGDWLATNVYALFDRWAQYAQGGPQGVTNLNDRRYGKSYPFYITEIDLQIMRFPSRIVTGTNPYAIGMLEGYTSYVAGDGFTKTVQARPGKDVPKEILAKLQGVIDDFAERNQWDGGEQPGLEEEMVQRPEIDGEAGLCLHEDDAGLTWATTFEAEQLTQPPGSDMDYLFGILTEKGNPQRPLKYWLRGWNTDLAGEEYDASQIVHFKTNVQRQMKRGIPTFSFSMNDTLQLADDLRHSLGVGGKAQAAIAMVRQWQSATQADVKSFNQTFADYMQPTANGGMVPTTAPVPGTVEDIPKDMAYVGGPAGTNGPAHIAILQACLRGAASRYNAPEWLGSADSSNNSFASGVIADSLFGRRIVREQKRFESTFHRIFWWALDTRCTRQGEIVATLADGTVARYDWTELKRLVELKVTAPPIEVRNKLEKAQEQQIKISGGWMAPQQAIVEDGGDVAETMEQIQEWREEMGGGQGGMEMPPDGAPPPGGPDAGSGNPFAPAAPLPSGTRTTAGAVTESPSSVPVALADADRALLEAAVAAARPAPVVPPPAQPLRWFNVPDDVLALLESPEPVAAAPPSITVNMPAQTIHLTEAEQIKLAESMPKPPQPIFQVPEQPAPIVNVPAQLAPVVNVPAQDNTALVQVIAEMLRGQTEMLRALPDAIAAAVGERGGRRSITIEKDADGKWRGEAK